MSENRDPIDIRIPRIAIAQPTSLLRGSNYRDQYSSTLPRSTDIINSPTYVADHLFTRRLSEIDNAYYLSNQLKPESRSAYGTTPVRIRSDKDFTRYSVTVTDGRRLKNDHLTENTHNNNRFTHYPATSEVIGLQPPTIGSLELSERSEEDRKSEQIAESVHDVNRLALFNNSSLAYQRICYLLIRYPAIALCLISTWMLWGRGLGLNLVNNNETIAYITSFTAGVFILCSEIILSSSHHNSYKWAKALANLYHFSNTISGMISIVIIVFSAISFQNVVDTQYLTCTWQSVAGTSECFSPNERRIFLSILIGSASFIIFLSIFGGLCGCIGQSHMKEKRQSEYKKYAAANQNEGFRY